MDDLLLNHIQYEEVGVRVDTCTKRYYPDDTLEQLVSLQDGTTMPVLYDGVLPYLPIVRPTNYEVHSFRKLDISSRDPWYPFLFNGVFLVRNH